MSNWDAGVGMAAVTRGGSPERGARKPVTLFLVCLRVLQVRSKESRGDGEDEIPRNGGRRNDGTW